MGWALRGTESNEVEPPEGGTVLGRGLGGLDVGFIVLFYFVFFESLIGRTPGKLLTGTRVVDEQGQKPSFGQILGRSLARMLPFEPLSFFGAENRGWHDSLSKTYVVKSRKS